MSFVSAFGQYAPLLVPDAIETGARIASTDDGQQTPRIRRRAGSASPPVNKQEAAMADQQVVVFTPQQKQAAQENELVKLLDACPNALKRSEMLIKVGFYKQELAKQAPMLADLDEELSAAVIEEWFASGDRLLKRAVWNVLAGDEEIPLAKAAPDNAGELALAAMLDECTDALGRGRLLHKIAMATTELSTIMAAEGVDKEGREGLIKQWLDGDSRDTPLRKNILDAEMGRAGRAIYGTGVMADQVVRDGGGSASTDTSSAMGGSETGTDQSIRRSLPRPPGGKLGTSDMPGQRGSKTATAPGGGKNDTGDGGASPTIIRRTTTTGGLGSTQGSDDQGRRLTTQQDKTAGGAGRDLKPSEAEQRRKDAKKGKDRWKAMDKAERAGELLKIAPDHLVESILTIENKDEQALVCQVAGEYAADLATWSAGTDPNKLQKAELDAAIGAWLAADPDTVPLKKFVAEALGTAEEIPLALAKAIMAWQPPPAFRVRRAA